VLLSACGRHELTPEELYEQQAGAVFSVYGTYASGDRFRGSGFFISGCGIAMTNHHVIADKVTAWAITHDGHRFAILGYYAYDLDNDIAVIQVGKEMHAYFDDGTEDPIPSGNHISTFQYVTLGDSDEVATGQDVFVISSPGGRRNTFHRTYVSRYAPVVTRICGRSDVYGIWEVVAPITGGSSGGAVFNANGEVVGLLSLALHSEPRTVGYFVPIDRLDRAGIVPGEYLPLPLWDRMLTDGYEPFPYVPVFGLASPNAMRLGTRVITDDIPTQGDEPILLFRHSEHLIEYSLPSIRAADDIGDDVVAYLEMLVNYGFRTRSYFTDEELPPGFLPSGMIAVVLYHGKHDISVIMAVHYVRGEVLIAICNGDVFVPIYGEIYVD
jgi:hypothetical protein